MIFHLNGQALVGGIEGGSLGNGPGFQDAADLQPEIVVQAGGGVLLDDKNFLAFAVGFPARLGRFGESPLASVLGQGRHGPHYKGDFRWYDRAVWLVCGATGGMLRFVSIVAVEAFDWMKGLPDCAALGAA
jgi:hypothetical protein